MTVTYVSGYFWISEHNISFITQFAVEHEISNAFPFRFQICRLNNFTSTFSVHFLEKF